MQTIISSPRFNSDGASRSIVNFLQQSPSFAGDDHFVIYYDYPIYSDYERTLYKPDLCIWTQRYGFFAIRVFSGVLAQFSTDALRKCDDELAEFSSLLFAKFVKSKVLRVGVQQIKFEIHPVIYSQDGGPPTHAAGIESEVARSLEALKQIIERHGTSAIDQAIFDEVRSIIEGAKALSAVTKSVAPGSSGPAADALLKLEYEIHNFDARQRQIALSLVPGPHRIRGLAGSGKTIILAAKAALIHLAEPDSKVLVTYYTRSLRETLRTLITRFYRHVRDDDPDWKMIHLRHGWGGSDTPGVYSDACRRAGLIPLAFSEAQSRSRSGNGKPALDPFDYACSALNQTNKVESLYDYVFIDEGQDFPDSFYQLCYSLAKDSINEKKYCLGLRRTPKHPQHSNS
jgi:superfamily I DNA and RNA helicase